MKTVYIYGGAERYGNYRRAVEAAGGRVRFGLRDAAEADALLLPGGGDIEPWRYGQENRACRGLEPERDAAELRLLARFTAAGKPVLGICRGFQTINVFFGGDLRQDVPGHAAAEGRDRRHPVRAVGDAAALPGPAGALAAVLAAFPEVNSAHHQAIGRLGRGLLLLQEAPDGIPEALAHTSLPVWGVQWHPERLPDAGLRLFRAFLALDPS